MHVPVVITGLVERGEAHSTKPGGMARSSFSKEGGQIGGMILTQEFHLAVNFTNDVAVLEIFVRMKIPSVVLNPFRDEERELALGAVRAKGGDAKEGRELVRHG